MSKFAVQKGIDVVFGAGAHRGFGHLGFADYLIEKNVLIACLIGVSVGSLDATFLANGFSPDEIEAIHLTELNTSHKRGLLTRLIAHLSPLRFIGEGFADLLGQTGFINPLGWIGLGYVDLLPKMRAVVKKYKLKPQPNLRIVAFDVARMQVVIFKGTNYNLAVALAASCAVPGLMRPVVACVQGRLRVLVDGGVYHLHPSSDRPAIISRLFYGALLNKLFANRKGDFPVDVGDPAVLAFDRQDAQTARHQRRFGYNRAKAALSGPIARGEIPVGNRRRRVQKAVCKAA